jgi:hypothetical protein
MIRETTFLHCCNQIFSSLAVSLLLAFFIFLPPFALAKLQNLK